MFVRYKLRRQELMTDKLKTEYKNEQKFPMASEGDQGWLHITTRTYLKYQPIPNLLSLLCV